MPKIHVDLPMLGGGVLGVSSRVSEVGGGWDLIYVLVGVYGAGCIFLIARLLRHFYMVRVWCKESVKSDSEWHYDLLKGCADQLSMSKLPDVCFSGRVNSPVITGLLNPTLLLPGHARRWSDGTLRMVMLHELGHMKRFDLWTSLAGQLACAFHWFNPVVWILRKRLREECEYACDAHVISCGAHPGHYINALCDVAESCQVSERSMGGGVAGNEEVFSVALSMASKASLRSRVENLLEEGQGKGRLSSFLVVGLLIVSASVAVAINLVRPDDRVRGIGGEGPASDQVVQGVESDVELRLSADPFPAD